MDESEIIETGLSELMEATSQSELSASTLDIASFPSLSSTPYIVGVNVRTLVLASGDGEDDEPSSLPILRDAISCCTPSFGKVFKTVSVVLVVASFLALGCAFLVLCVLALAGCWLLLLECALLALL